MYGTYLNYKIDPSIIESPQNLEDPQILWRTSQGHVLQKYFKVKGLVKEMSWILIHSDRNRQFKRDHKKDGVI